MALAQDSVAFRHISDEIMLHGTCYDNLKYLCKHIGNRISGSEHAAQAVKWGEQAMKDAGAEKVWIQPVLVPHWVRGKESLQIRYKTGGLYKPAPMLSLGNSVGTGGKPLKADIIVVHRFEELKAMPEEKVKGKIVFFNYRFRQDLIQTGEAYGDAVKYRGGGPDAAIAKGAVGVIIRSVSSGADNFPHTGGTHYADSTHTIPAIAVGNLTADSLEKFCNINTVSVIIQSECKMATPQYVQSYNIIGEIKGSEFPEEIIVVGGHLDSWDVGEGAHDDGTGIVQSIEVMRALKALGIKPKRTIRAVLFMNEENGLRGGIAYADSALAQHEKHIMAIETDAGGFSPRGFAFEISDEKRLKIMKYKDLFLPYGVYSFERNGGGADISPLKKQEVPQCELLPDQQRYFDVHHTNNDVFENVNHRELKLGAVALCQLIYLISEQGL